MALKMSTTQNTLKSLLTNTVKYAPEDTPPHSDVSSEHSPPSSPEYSTPMTDDCDDEVGFISSPQPINSTISFQVVPISKGMLDHSRLTLCIFMLAMVAFNPFGFALNKISNAESISIPGGRSMLACMSILKMPYNCLSDKVLFRERATNGVIFSLIPHAVDRKYPDFMVLPTENVCLWRSDNISKIQGSQQVLDPSETGGYSSS